jgi:hypothetical protein
VSLTSSPITQPLPKDRLVEYRIVKTKPPLLAKTADYDVTLARHLNETLRTIMLHVLVDNERALLMTKRLGDEKNLTGASVGVPGIPAIIRATWERMLALFTTDLQ